MCFHAHILINTDSHSERTHILKQNTVQQHCNTTRTRIARQRTLPVRRRPPPRTCFDTGRAAASSSSPLPSPPAPPPPPSRATALAWSLPMAVWDAPSPSPPSSSSSSSSSTNVCSGLSISSPHWSSGIGSSGRCGVYLMKRRRRRGTRTRTRTRTSRKRSRAA